MGATASKEAEIVREPVLAFDPPSNDYQLVFEAIKDIENTLVEQFDSSGDHLHEMISTTNQKLPTDLIIDLRALATIRNNLAHEYSFDKLPDRQAFIEKYQQCARQLKEEIKRRKEEEEKFYNQIVQKHRQSHPRPTFVVEKGKGEPETQASQSPLACIACF